MEFAVAGAALAGLAAYAAAWEPYAVRLRRVRLLCPRLPREFDGFTVLQLTDLHMNQMGRRERNLHRLTAGLGPDIIAVTGDLCWDDLAARGLAAIIRDARAREGAYAISGNADIRHPEFYAGVKRVLKESGVVFLDNRHVLLRRGEAVIVLAGVEDPHTGQDDLVAALDGAPQGAFVFLLAHSPAITVAAIEMGVDVVIGGHTHGGQLALPLVGPLFTRSGHGKGLAAGHVYGRRLKSILGIDPGNTQVYVSRGVGASFIPVRFLCPPEVTLFTLVSA